MSWDEAVARAEASGLVTFTPTVEFRHPLVRSAIYYAATAADRRRAHAALAGALDAEGDADRRAWHLGAAARRARRAVARALEASAERARRRGGSSAAARTCGGRPSSRPIPSGPPSGCSRRRAPSWSPATDRRRATCWSGPGRTGSAARHRAEAAWTEALVHIVDGAVREPAALLAERCRWSAPRHRARRRALRRRRRRRARRWPPRRDPTRRRRRGHAGRHRSLRHPGAHRAAGGRRRRPCG